MTKIVGLNGKEYKWRFKNHDIDDSNKSAPHLKCRAVLKELFPYDYIFEEQLIPGSQLFIDFVLPLRKLCIEVHGLQHYEFNSFFYKNLGEFKAAQNRDKLKQEFIKSNGWHYVELDARLTSEDWKRIILNSFNS